MRSLATTSGLISTVVTFEPHPKAFFSPAHAPKKIQGLRDKADALANLGVDELWVLRFRHQLATMTADEFMTRVLHQELHAKAIVIGDDFCFGAKRQGNFDMLVSASDRFGWQVQRLSTVSLDRERVSSSGLRNALAAGDLAMVQALMGRPYTLCGHVIHGRKLGRNLGFPTLNIPVPRDLIISGIFVVSVEGITAQPITGVASLGHRPTVEQSGRLLLEVHLFDWQGDAYGRLVRVTLHQKLRDEIHYTNVDDMTQQIQLDAQQARDYFSHHAH
jgi:riboflavin kinase/FMN adenylyltransferase